MTTNPDTLPRREVLQLGVVGACSLALGGTLRAQDAPAKPRGDPTKFQIACMTLPYSQYPLDRALLGLKTAGYRFVAWGTSHKEPGESRGLPVMPADAAPLRARELGLRCRDAGLEPLLMFSEIYPEAPRAVEVLTLRIRQAQAAGIPQVLTFGHTNGAHRKTWVERFRQLGPIARDHGVLIVIKQHGETGQITGDIVREVNDAGILVNYDAGNVMDYTRGETNPLVDLATCADLVRSFCIKDHRMSPVDQDCGPGLGEIDHYRLLHPLAFTGRALPLCCENISAPGLRASTPERIDELARRAREFLELVTQGLQA